MTSEATDHADLPVWLHPRRDRPNDADVDGITETFTAEDPRFAVRADRLEALLRLGYQPIPRFLFSLENVEQDPIGPTNSSNKLGLWLHEAVVKSGDIEEAGLETLAVRREAIGQVLKWSDRPAFPAILDYLRDLARMRDRSLQDFTFRGRPAPSLRKRLETRHKPDTSLALDVDVDSQTSADSLPVAREVLDKLRDSLNVIVEGVAGSGKSHLIHQLRRAYQHVELVVFHPSTSYEEFVSGLRPTADGGFHGRAGVFIEMCIRAARNPDELFLLFVDEINRANTSRVFGDLLLPLEKSKRVDFGETALDEALLRHRPPGDDVSVRLQTPVDVLPDVGPAPDDTEVIDVSIERFSVFGQSQRPTDPLGLGYLVVPQNLHVLGTMNSTDRSVGSIDLALRRRFTWMDMQPLTKDELLENTSVSARVSEDPEWSKVIDWYGTVNERLLAQLGPDARLGHSYFFAEARAGGTAALLLTQLAEIIHVFNAPEALLAALPELSLASQAVRWRIAYVGAGLGRRPVVRSEPTTVQ
jgi:5-methylcytosine-specific restriction protein B